MDHGMRLIVALAALLMAFAAQAGHTQGEEINAVIMTCRLHRAAADAESGAAAGSGVLEVESVSVNSTRNDIPHASLGGSCAEYLHEYLTAGFEIVNRETSGYMFVLTRRDKSYPGSHH